MAEVNKNAQAAVGASEGKEQGSGRGIRKRQTGIVVSNKMDKTIVVSVVRQVRHRTYGKFIRQTKKFYAHDESGQCGVGDRVSIVETRPLSKLKRWKLESVLTKAE